jgi:hypothetical protein
MRDFITPAPGVPFLTQTTAQNLDQMHDRLLSEVRSHERRAVHWKDGNEPNVELSMDEARMMADRLTKASHLLRLASEGMLS